MDVGYQHFRKPPQNFCVCVGYMAYEKILEVLATFRQHGSLRLVVARWREEAR